MRLSSYLHFNKYIFRLFRALAIAISYKAEYSRIMHSTFAVNRIRRHKHKAQLRGNFSTGIYANSIKPDNRTFRISQSALIDETAKVCRLETRSGVRKSTA